MKRTAKPGSRKARRAASSRPASEEAILAFIAGCLRDQGSGEIAVVVIGEEATVKRYFPRRNKILLLPENDDYEPIEVRPTDPETRVAGKVVGVFRQPG